MIRWLVRVGQFSFRCDDEQKAPPKLRLNGAPKSAFSGRAIANPKLPLPINNFASEPLLLYTFSIPEFL